MTCRTQREVEADGRRLDEVLECGVEFAISWLKEAFHTHESQIAHLLNDIKELRLAFLVTVTRPLSVREAQLCRVCRVCRKPESAPFLYSFGEEYAHQECLVGKPK